MFAFWWSFCLKSGLNYCKYKWHFTLVSFVVLIRRQYHFCQQHNESGRSRSWRSQPKLFCIITSCRLVCYLNLFLIFRKRFDVVCWRFFYIWRYLVCSVFFFLVQWPQNGITTYLRLENVYHFIVLVAIFNQRCFEWSRQLFTNIMRMLNFPSYVTFQEHNLASSNIFELAYWPCFDQKGKKFCWRKNL